MEQRCSLLRQLVDAERALLAAFERAQAVLRKLGFGRASLLPYNRIPCSVAYSVLSSSHHVPMKLVARALKEAALPNTKDDR